MFNQDVIAAVVEMRRESCPDARARTDHDDFALFGHLMHSLRGRVASA